jgi:hypothetical protein
MIAISAPASVTMTTLRTAQWPMPEDGTAKLITCVIRTKPSVPSADSASIEAVTRRPAWSFDIGAISAGIQRPNPPPSRATAACQGALKRFYDFYVWFLLRRISVVRLVDDLMPQRILLFGSIARPTLHKLDVPPGPWPEGPFAHIPGPVVGILPSPNWRASTGLSFGEQLAR